MKHLLGFFASILLTTLMLSACCKHKPKAQATADYEVGSVAFHEVFAVPSRNGSDTLYIEVRRIMDTATASGNPTWHYALTDCTSYANGTRVQSQPSNNFHW